MDLSDPQQLERPIRDWGLISLIFSKTYQNHSFHKLEVMLASATGSFSSGIQRKWDYGIIADNTAKNKCSNLSWQVQYQVIWTLALLCGPSADLVCQKDVDLFGNLIKKKKKKIMEEFLCLFINLSVMYVKKLFKFRLSPLPYPFSKLRGLINLRRALVKTSGR